MTLFEKKVFTEEAKCPLTPKTGLLIKEERTQKDTQRTPSEDRGKDSSNVTTSQEMLGPLEVGRGMEELFLRVFRGTLPILMNL